MTYSLRFGIQIRHPGGQMNVRARVERLEQATGAGDPVILLVHEFDDGTERVCCNGVCERMTEAERLARWPGPKIVLITGIDPDLI